MEVSESSIRIKEEDTSDEICSRKILASKIYRITEHQDQEDGENYNSGFCISKEDVDNENDYDFNDLEFEENGEDIYEHLEFQDTNSTDNEFIDAKFNVESLQDTRSKNLQIKEQNQFGVVEKVHIPNYIIHACPICETDFPNSTDWRKHLYDVHEFNNIEKLNIEFCTDGKAKCKQCNLTMYGKLSVLQQHRITHLPYNKYYKCKLCYKPFTTARQLRNHLVNQHTNANTFPGATKATAEFAIFLCPYCGIEYPNKHKWLLHLYQIHRFNKLINLNMDIYEDKTAKCKECHAKLVAKNKCALQEHKITHLPYNRYVKCKVCRKYFTRIQGLTYHLKKSRNSHCPNQEYGSSSTDRLILCPFCDRVFSDSSDWRQHLNDSHEFNKRANLNIECLK